MRGLPAWFGACIAGLALLAVTLAFDRVEQDRFRAEIRAQVRDQINTRRSIVETKLSARLEMVRALGGFVRAEHGTDLSGFAIFAQSLTEGRDGIRGLVLAPGGVISLVYPMDSNQSAIGVDLMAIPRFQPMIRRTIETNSLTVGGPHELVQGGTGLIGRVPVFLGQGDKRALWGLAIIVLDLPQLLQDANLDQADGLDIAIRGRDGLGAAGEVFHGDPALFTADPVLVDVHVPAGKWQIAARPKNGWTVHSPRRPWALGGGLVISLLSALVIYSLLSQAARLRDALDRGHEREMDLQKAIDALGSSNAELERFAYVASHDLQEPLRSIISFAQLLERRCRAQLQGADLEYLDFIVGGAKRMHALVNDLLAYSRVTNKGAPFQRVDLKPLVERVLMNLHDSIDSAGAKVVVEPLAAVTGDEMQLTQLFQNLIANAVKFRRPGHFPLIQVTAQIVGPLCRVAVTDDGIGIAPEYRDHVFTVFRRLHSVEAYPGTGIGLAICRRILDRHNGRIWIETPDQGGTRFVFDLPLSLESRPEAG